MADSDTEECRALTEDGERCSRPAQADGFCHQHDEDDPTVDDVDDQGGDEPTGEDSQEATTNDEMNDDTEDGAETDDGADTEDGAETDDESQEAETTDRDADGTEFQVDGTGLVAVREALQSVVPRLIGREMDGVVEVASGDDGWRGTIEIVERSAVPDTQDILGRYEVDVDADGTVTEYRRVDRYRRGDVNQGDSLE